MEAMGLSHVGEIGTVCEDHDEHMFFQEIQQYDSEFYDDLSGKPLDPKLVRAARAEEIEGARAHKVWIKVPTSECYERTGKKPVATRWVQVNKGDENDPDYRSRWVGREFFLGPGHGS